MILTRLLALAFVLGSTQITVSAMSSEHSGRLERENPSMKHRLLILLAALSLCAHAQTWSAFLDSSRAVDWTSAGFTIPTYTSNCSIQPSLTANDSTAAAANTTAIMSALTSCDATHNVVNIPAGTYYTQGWTYGSQGKQVVRGAGPMSTTIYISDSSTYGAQGCGGFWLGICMIPANAQGSGSPAVTPPSGAQQCLWTGGYAQGTTTITLGSCGGAPTANQIMVLSQANDGADTGGIYICDSQLVGCTVENSGNYDGQVVGGVTSSEQQVTYVTGVVNNGNGTYSVTISPGVYFNNIRISQTPRARWPNTVRNDGLENMTVDHSLTTTNTAVAMFNCYQCWVKNVRSLYAGRDHVFLYQTLSAVIRDSYFYQAQSHGSQSYGVELETDSSVLIENNIFQQITNSVIFGQGSGSVVGYNYSVDNQFGTGVWAQTANAGHNAGNGMNLWEGNNFLGIWSDDSWGASAVSTLFRNQLPGWQSGKSEGTFPVSLESWSRAFNVIGNVLGQPSYHNIYESYATSATGGVNGGDTAVNHSIYALGWTGNTTLGACTTPPTCDPMVRSTLMRWGNYDTVTNGTKWDSVEASPAAVVYVNANFTSSYFSSLAQTLPASLYYTSQPSWWPLSKAWPPTGPDVSSGNLGTCSGTYAGSQATSSSQCAGGTLNSAWAGHANSIPAQDCYLNVMGGPPDGTGSVLSFDANTCYNGSGGATLFPPTGLSATVN